MRALFLAAGLAIAAPIHALAQDAAEAPATPEAKIEALQQRLLASQQTIATLERELAEEKNRAVALDRCRVKNGRLVRIARQMVEGYMARYRQTHHDPFQLGRRRFEFEMQALSEAVYDAQSEVPDKPVAPAADPAPVDPASAPAPARAPAPSQP